MISVNLDVVLTHYLGFIFVILGLFLVVYGFKQSKKDFDMDNVPFIKPVLKEVLGAFLILFGLVQIIPILGNIL